MSNYCCSPYQNEPLDCNKVLDCLNQLMNVLTPPSHMDVTDWANMPLNDKLSYILDNLGGGTTVTPPPISTLPIEVVNLNATEFTKVFTQGSILDSIIVDTNIAADFSVNIGTQAFGAEIENDLPINGSKKPYPLEINYYFKTSETWYFSGLPSTGKIIFVYKLLI